EPDQPGAALLQPNERPVVMALAPAEAGSVAVDRDQWDEHQVWLHLGVAPCGLHDSERAGLERVAGNEAERLGGVGEAGESGDRADRARFLHRGQRADLRAE